MSDRGGDRAGRGPAAIAGRSEAVRRLVAQLDAVADADATVLLTGETGTGKGLAARQLHALSGRAGRFVQVDCTALAAGLCESELFGHERGAFTGAEGRRLGRFEHAAGGTIFLDEIGDLPRAQQPKLLRVLEERRFERLGSNRTLSMTARVVAATHRDLEREVAEGRFRADLWYRLRVVELVLPPLRDRPEDLPALVHRALARCARGRPAALEPGFWEVLAAHRWPGNVRELMHGVERLLLLHPGRVWSADHGRALVGGAPAGPPAPGPAAAGGAERRAIEAALLASGGNVARAARRLRVPRGTLRHRIQRHGLHHLIPRD